MDSIESGTEYDTAGKQERRERTNVHVHERMYACTYDAIERMSEREKIEGRTNVCEIDRSSTYVVG